MEAKREIIQRIREKSSRIQPNYGKSSNGLNRAFFEAQKIRESSITVEKVPLWTEVVKALGMILPDKGKIFRGYSGNYLRTKRELFSHLHWK
ncbi:MAG: hypothetical protein BroJett011_59680 [Chloroflexota bacterium]|nr:MAG: hypothetical protein BroJett011_59680 [Chloroflexota bacterium]